MEDRRDPQYAASQVILTDKGRGTSSLQIRNQLQPQPPPPTPLPPMAASRV
jgi:hypothetical protein